MGGDILSSDKMVFINDVGTDTSDSHPPLVCTTDKEPCCQRHPRYGEWYYPDGQLIPNNVNAVTFYRNRDNEGNVNLFRASSNVISPTGRFCCEIPDATSTNYTHCVNIRKIHNSIALYSCMIAMFKCIIIIVYLYSHTRGRA